MQLVEIYQLIYYGLVTILSIAQINLYKNTLNHRDNERQRTAVFFLVLFMILLIGLRPPDDYWFADSFWYNSSYHKIEGCKFIFNRDADNLIWDNLFNYFASKNLGISNLFLLSDVLYFGCAYLACRKFFPKDTFAAYLVFLGAFSTFSYSYNGIKAGIAASVFLLALAYRSNLILSIVLVLVSWGFHHSMQLPVVAYIIARIYPNPKVYFYVWIFCILIAICHISFFQSWFASMTDETGSKYLTQNAENWGEISGFRPDFIAYSAMPILIAYTAMYNKSIRLSKNYRFILSIYLITNSVWMLCMYARFTNRIAYLSWFLYPIVLIYPFLKENWGTTRYKAFAKAMAYQLAFTLFMQLIYYNFIRY